MEVPKANEEGSQRRYRLSKSVRPTKDLPNSLSQGREDSIIMITRMQTSSGAKYHVGYNKVHQKLHRTKLPSPASPLSYCGAAFSHPPFSHAPGL